MRSFSSVRRFISEYQKNCPEGKFFNETWLDFFGEKIENMYLCPGTVSAEDYDGVHECYKLSTYQKNNPFGPQRAFFYFDAETFRYLPDAEEVAD